jgi:hypothetical protein
MPAIIAQVLTAPAAVAVSSIILFIIHNPNRIIQKNSTPYFQRDDGVVDFLHRVFGLL